MSEKKLDADVQRELLVDAHVAYIQSLDKVSEQKNVRCTPFSMLTPIE